MNLRERVTKNTALLYYGMENEGEVLTIGCQDCSWTVFSGLEDFSDYVLPSGEIACLPVSVDGAIIIDGWIIGTIPFGLKYGRIRRGELELRFEKREVVRVNGSNHRLCADVEAALNRAPRLRLVSEVGIGQSRAVARAAAKHKLGYHWHEPHYGLHLGLGAELPDQQEPNDRKTGGHHLDIVLSSGRLTGSNHAELLNW